MEHTGKVSCCKECRRGYHRKWAKEHPEIISRCVENYRKSGRMAIVTKAYRQKNKEKCLLKAKEWQRKNRDHYLACRRRSYARRKKYLMEIAKRDYLKYRPRILAYQKANEERMKPLRNQYLKNKLASDPMFKTQHSLRNRMWAAFKARGWKKNSKTQELIGSDFDTARKFIESKFSPGMSWKNHGEWHIDHIIPVAAASDEKEMEKLFHYTNLQPLWAIENMKKGKKFDGKKENPA